MNREYLDSINWDDEDFVYEDYTHEKSVVVKNENDNLENNIKEEKDIVDSEVITPRPKLEDIVININDFDIRDEDAYDDYYGAYETMNRLERKLGFGTESRALALAREYAEKLEMEKNRKKERERLYKTDKKCYNLIKDDKNCKKDKTEDRIFTRVNIRKIKKLLRYEGITYKEVAKALNVSERSMIRKLNVYTDLTANELITICDLLNININEVIYKNEH